MDIAWLVAIRICFGVALFTNTARYCAKELLGSSYTGDAFQFTYLGFGWISPWPGVGMAVHFGVLAVLALAIAVGFLYRLAAALFCAGFTYVFLLDKATYLNHFYLICLLAFLLALFLPAHRALSFDAWSRRTIYTPTVDVWTLWLLRFQVGLVYFYAGIAKLNGDWLAGEPIRSWLGSRQDAPLVGGLVDQEWFVDFVAFGGVAFDLLAAPLLLWKRTRPWMFLCTVFFHLTNALIFDIGVFPWLMLGMTTVFFAPDWPRQLLRRASPEVPKAAAIEELASARQSRPNRLLLAGAVLYAVLQVLVPLRHHLYPGDVAWTEEGHRFSWRMKLRDKEGKIWFVANDRKEGKSWTLPIDHLLTERQKRKMAGVPDMILQLAHQLAADLRRQGKQDVAVYAHAFASLNGRPYQRLVDPNVDLSSVPRDLWPALWIVPLED